MKINLYNKQTGEMEAVECWSTATPHFVVTRPMQSTDPDIDLGDLFNVTHKNSTALALGPFKDQRLAALCASILGHLPVPWDDFTMGVSSHYKKPDPDQEKRFKLAWGSLPVAIHKWRKAVSDSCIYGDDDSE